MSTFVVDANVAVKWVVAEDDSELAVGLVEHRLLAPSLLLGEAANALWVKVRRGEISAEEAEEGLATLREAPVEMVPEEHLVTDGLALALRLAHPVYDCLYLALAIRLGVQVVTADGRFLAAVRRDEELDETVLPLGEVAGLGEDGSGAA